MSGSSIDALKESEKLTLLAIVVDVSVSFCFLYSGEVDSFLGHSCHGLHCPFCKVFSEKLELFFLDRGFAIFTTFKSYKFYYLLYNC